MISNYLRLIYFGFFCHFLLADYDHNDWLFLRYSGIFALILLAFEQELKLNRLMSIILVCSLIINKTLTLFFLRDVLTQSFYLWLLLWILLRYQWIKHIPPWGEDQNDQIKLFERLLRPGICLLTASVYFLAAIHKINTDFLMTSQSCALHGVEIIVKTFHLPQWIQILGESQFFDYRITAILIILLELSIGVLLIYQNPLSLLIAIPFHLPLTLTIAPAFGLIMIGGLIFSIQPNEMARLKALRTKPYFQIILLLMVALVFWAKSSIQWLDFIKTYLYLYLFLGMIDLQVQTRSIMRYWVRVPMNLAVIPMMIFGIHGLLFPYLGLEMQHSSAMLSNLRIESRCHNSLIFPNLGIDPYLYLDEVRFNHYTSGEPFERAQKLTQTLWHWTAFYTMKKNWCPSHLEPIYFKGHNQKTTFDIQNLCDDQAFKALADQLDIGFCELPQWQRFQKNLSIDCHDACVH